jgi:hypothetical protein
VALRRGREAVLQDVALRKGREAALQDEVIVGTQLLPSALLPTALMVLEHSEVLVS